MEEKLQRGCLRGLDVSINWAVNQGGMKEIMFDETMTIKALAFGGFLDKLFEELETRLKQYGFDAHFQQIKVDDSNGLELELGITVTKDTRRVLSDYYEAQKIKLEDVAFKLLREGMPESVWSALSREIERLAQEESKALVAHL